ncbi:MAG: hypothetical protein HN742_06715 [Lentisphaerae bacterium]|nr:hypothetical protein [Lentisphaerota bacterium]MBT4822853.1 hypothetical protein [Lentisphaerota bacterium]MBT5605873.1 hypothetical protein [Lentisphaerota bacterium]MBT7055962.1 hypothetical protein [Lentisphaerota bacterium]MBT7841545.1 hypothetical protein [Lentisphaerota bacterium]
MKHVILVLAVASSTAILLAADTNPRREKIRKAVVKQYDANGNGRLDAAERAVILKTYDANGNGQLDKQERQALARDVAGKQGPKADGDGDGNQKDEEPSEWNTPGFKQANSMGGREADIPKGGTFRVFVLMGQSNMAGAARAAELKAPYNSKHDRIRIWANGRWEYFVPRQRSGPGVAMAHQLAEFWPNDTIGIIKVAVGGTGIRAFERNWSKERAERTFDGKKGPLYQDLMNAVAEAKEVSKPVFSGLVWKQGAADGTRKDLADEYHDTFKRLVSDVRNDLSAPDMPVFVLTYASDEDLAKKTLTGKRKHLKTVLMAHNKAGRDIPNTTTIHHGKLPTNADGIHFNTEGQIKLGKMTAAAVEAFYGAKE